MVDTRDFDIGGVEYWEIYSDIHLEILRKPENLHPGHRPTYNQA
jgi:hypothetical protein